jgi:hypothetical protein
MSLKDNINKIHSNLLINFKEVYISEKNSLEWGNYFEIKINESNKLVKALISKRDVEKKSFKWKYYSNPNDDKSYLVERDSTVDNFSLIIKDIFEKDRFDSDYLKSLND